MEKPVFLIVTPVLNGDIFVSECIASIRSAFQHFAFKHVIVDGGSTDNTKKIVKDHKHGDLVFLKRPGSTMYQAINKGLDYIEADYFYQLNVDDLVLPEAPHIVYRHFKSDDSIDVISGSCLSINIETNYCKLKVPTKNQFKIDRIGINLFVSQPSTFVRYEVMKKVGGFSQNLKYAGDMDLWLKLIKNGHKFSKVNQCLSVDRIHSKCVRKSIEHINGLKIVRQNYLSPEIIMCILKLSNSTSYILTQLLSMIRLHNFTQGGFQYYGSLFFRILGTFFTTKRAGIRLNYSFINGTYGFQGRLW